MSAIRLALEIAPPMRTYSTRLEEQLFQSSAGKTKSSAITSVPFVYGPRG